MNKNLELENEKLRAELNGVQKTNSEYADMISKMDAEIMRARSENSIFRNELKKVSKNILLRTKIIDSCRLQTEK